LQAQQLGDGKDVLAVGHFGQDFRFQPGGEQGYTLGVARGAEIAPAARKGQQHFLPAVGVFADNTSETTTKIAAIEESIRHTAHHGPPMAVRVVESLVENLLEEGLHTHPDVRGEEVTECGEDPWNNR
jgi:hypothetical protein